MKLLKSTLGAIYFLKDERKGGLVNAAESVYLDIFLAEIETKVGGAVGTERWENPCSLPHRIREVSKVLL